MIENDTPIYVNNTQNENVEIKLCLPAGIVTKTKTSRLKEESRPDGYSIRQSPRHFHG